MRRRKQARPDVPRVLGYIRVSTAEQALYGAGPEAQREAIDRAAAAYGWQIVEYIADNGTSGTVDPERRQGLSRALSMLDNAEADVLLAMKVDRVSRSTLDLLRLYERSERCGWQLLTLDLPFDTSTPVGKAMRNMLAVFAQLERDFIAQRTREGLAVKRAQGVMLGRPVELPAEVGRQIVELRESGMTWQQIADQLTAQGVPTARGGDRWSWQTAQSVHARLTREIAPAG